MTYFIHDSVTTATYITVGPVLIRGDNLVTNAGVFYSVVDDVTLLVDGSVTSTASLFSAVQGYFDEVSVSTSGSILGSDIGLHLDRGTETRVINSGTIAAAPAAYLAHAAAINANSDLYLINTGTIENMRRLASHGSHNAILHDPTQASYSAEITNAGQILGDIRLGEGSDTVENYGLIEGVIYLGDGNDTFRQEGGQIVDGRVVGGDGSDTYYIDDASIDLRESFDEGLDNVYSSVTYKLKSYFENLYLTGNDDIKGVGNTEDNSLSGNDGDNVLRGKAGDDTFWASEGIDVIRGGSGADLLAFSSLGVSGVKVKLSKGVWTDPSVDAEATIFFSGIEDLFGTSGDDVLIGDANDNELFGFFGNDTLKGGDGSDMFYGSYGQDKMIGGRGSDTFVFFETFESSSDRTSADVIKDYQSGTDRIDISALTATHFVGKAAFSGVMGEIRYDKAEGFLEVDTSGDGTANFAVNLGAGTKLVEVDLLL